MSRAPTRGPAWGFLATGGLVIVGLLAVFVRGFSLDPHRIESPLVDQPAPSFELPTLSTGQMVNSESLRGTPLVLNFWATWCESCPREHPLLVQASRYYNGRVQFVGVAYNDKNEILKAWLDKHGGAAYPTLVDISGKAAIAYGVYGVPETYVVDRGGVVRFKHTGMVNPAALREQLDGLL